MEKGRSSKGGFFNKITSELNHMIITWSLLSVSPASKPSMQNIHTQVLDGDSDLWYIIAQLVYIQQFKMVF